MTKGVPGLLFLKPGLNGKKRQKTGLSFIVSLGSRGLEFRWRWSGKLETTRRSSRLSRPELEAHKMIA